MKFNWGKHEAKVESYLDNEEAVVIYIIKTGFKDKYIVTFDDADELFSGTANIMTKEQIKGLYGIELQI